MASGRRLHRRRTDQSFSYIAAIRPAVAFMIDIRRDNLLMHLMFKALPAVGQSTGIPQPLDRAGRAA
jgi:hypothetical protein